MADTLEAHAWQIIREFNELRYAEDVEMLRDIERTYGVKVMDVSTEGGFDAVHAVKPDGRRFTCPAMFSSRFPEHKQRAFAELADVPIRAMGD